MATIGSALPALSGDLELFHTTDPLLSNSPVLVFHGAAASIGATSSRIQVHVFTPAGNASYARLAISPTSPFYSAVRNLPREEQGDEICRGIAFGLKKYFAELPDNVKKAWQAQSKLPLQALFGDNHIAILASRITRIENVQSVIDDLSRAFGPQTMPWIDVDVVLPPGTIKVSSKRTDSAGPEFLDDAEELKHRYGPYAELIAALGEPSFLPTSKLKRAPSKANSVGRSTSFSTQQRENARNEISELLDTEQNYVNRLEELQSLTDNLGADLKQANKQQLLEIFPTSIETIRQLNTNLLEALSKVFDGTQSTVGDEEIEAIAKCFCEWFPQFAEPYADYMSTHSAAAMSLRKLLRGDSVLSDSLIEAGEQRLTSLLIEPVQRLPRYNLYIDSIAKQLPARHLALRPLMKARDLISDICTKEDDEAGTMSVLERLRTRVANWPADAEITGRIITAVDACELAPPYALDKDAVRELTILVFTDSVIFLERNGSAANARSLLAELDGSRQPVQRPGTPSNPSFLRRVRIGSLEATGVLDNQALQVLTYSPLPNHAHGGPSLDDVQCLLLQGSYEGKAGRLLEEIAKARVEDRFTEDQRESPKWDVRASQPTQDQVSLFSAVFESSHQTAACGPTRVVLDLEKHSQRPRAGTHGIQTVFAISPQRDGTCRVSVDTVEGPASHEHIPRPDVFNYICKKIGSLATVHFNICSTSMTSCLLERNGEVLKSIDLVVVQEEEEVHKVPQAPTRENSLRSRPLSPVKMLSSFLSSTGPGTQPPAFLKKDLPALPTPRMPPPQHIPAPKPPSRESRPSSKDQATPRSLHSMRSTEVLSTSYKRLEDTLSTYMLALQARKGNIVGRNLKIRATADELAVSELYNSLLEDPNMMVLAAQASVDVLFVAFEKFLNGAWKEQVGQVMPAPTMQEIQTKAETLFPTDFDTYFRSTLSSMAPQNQRAFKGIMRLLADLLDGTGNDSDRGILTAAFAELLVPDGDSRNYIALIDRFVDDTDTYFGEPLSDIANQGDNTQSGHKRTRSVNNTGSVGSNTSSLRKKFGFGGLSRENSKSEQESKVNSVWRTLSKSTRGDSPAGSISRGTLQRSQSTDVDGRLNLRPTSQDGSMSRRTPALEDVPSLAGPSSATNLGLSTIGEHPCLIPKTGPPKKKRRSSLSDIKALEVAQKSPPWSPPAARRLPVANAFSIDKSLPNSPVPSTPSSKGGSGRFGSPIRDSPRPRLPASFRSKENSPGPAKAYSTPIDLRPKSSGSALPPASTTPALAPPAELTISARPTSNIPTFGAKSNFSPHRNTISSSRGLSERPGLANILKKPSPEPEKLSTSALKPVAITPTTSPTKKLRVQSPQKIRERLGSLQNELDKIGDELGSTPGRQIATLTARVSAIQADVTSSLAVSESKNSSLDALYREANSENEALYSRFNDEMTRIFRAVKGGNGVEEMRKQLKEALDEGVKLRRENARLKREGLGLRAQLRE